MARLSEKLQTYVIEIALQTAVACLTDKNWRLARWSSKVSSEIASASTKLAVRAGRGVAGSRRHSASISCLSISRTFPATSFSVGFWTAAIEATGSIAAISVSPPPRS